MSAEGHDNGHEHEHHHKDTFITKYIFSLDHKMKTIPYYRYYNGNYRCRMSMLF
jgi:cytochrome c oxidase subunit 1